MFRRSCEAREPCVQQRLLCSEAKYGVVMEKGTDEVLGCDIGPESKIRQFPQVVIGPRRTFIGDVLPVSIVEVNPHHFRLQCRNRNRAHTAPIAFLQRRRRSKISRRQQG